MKWLATVLLCCLGCHGPPVVPVPAPELPPIPAYAVSQLGPVPVVWVDSLTDAHGASILGGFSYTARTIYIRNDLRKELRVAWVVYGHETCHVWMADTGLYNSLTEVQQQQVCDASAIYRVAEMLTERSRRLRQRDPR